MNTCKFCYVVSSVYSDDDTTGSEINDDTGTNDDEAPEKPNLKSKDKLKTTNSSTSTIGKVLKKKSQVSTVTVIDSEDDDINEQNPSVKGGKIIKKTTESDEDKKCVSQYFHQL